MNACDQCTKRGSGKAFYLLINREQAVAEALLFGHVKRESLDLIPLRSAWKGYTTARKDIMAVVSAAAAADEEEASGAGWGGGGGRSSSLN